MYRRTVSPRGLDRSIRQRINPGQKAILHTAFGCILTGRRRPQASTRVLLLPVIPAKAGIHRACVPFPNRNFEYYRLLLRRAQRRECEKAQGTILPNRTTKTSQPGNPENLLAELLTGSAGLARFLWANPAPPYGQTAALRDSLNVPVLQAKLDGAGTSGIIVGGCTVTQVRR
jgi:hypothetical protein